MPRDGVLHHILVVGHRPEVRALVSGQVAFRQVRRGGLASAVLVPAVPTTLRRPEQLADPHLQPAQRMMAVADHGVLADATHVSSLPASWGTLYELSRLEPDHLERAIETGA